MKNLIPFMAILATSAVAAELSLTWSDNSNNESGFTVERSIDGTNFLPIADVPADTEVYADTALAPSTEYWYRVQAWNNFGVSGYAGPASGITKAEGSPPGAPGTINLSNPGQLINLSTRSTVNVGAEIVIGGLVVTGDPIDVLIRGVGPALGQAPFWVPGALSDPMVELVDSAGAVVAVNDNWSGSEIEAAAAQVGAFALTPGSLDSSLLVTLPAGTYTIKLSGVNGATGVGLIEVYHVK